MTDLVDNHTDQAVLVAPGVGSIRRVFRDRVFIRLKRLGRRPLNVIIGYSMPLLAQVLTDCAVGYG